MAGLDDIPDGSIVLLDTATLVYFLEGHPKYLGPAERLLGRIEAGVLSGVMATLVLTELLVPLYRAGRNAEAEGLAGQLAHYRNTALVPLDRPIALTASRLRAELGLRTPDAIHAATARAAGCTGIATNDRRLRVLGREGLEVWLFDPE